MLVRLKLRNVGSAPELDLAYRPRVNLLTGDNGLGKTFLSGVETLSTSVLCSAIWAWSRAMRHCAWRILSMPRW